MKKVFTFSILTIWTLASTAQYDPQAKVVLDAMSTKYKKVAAFSAEFTQKIENPNSKVEEEMKGKITVKGNKYVLTIIGNEVYNNGKEVWTYTPEAGENGEVTVSQYNPSEEEITPGNVYDLYKKGFKYALISQLPNGDRVIELDPEDRKKDFHKIRLIIDKENSMKTFTVFEKSGNRYVYTVKGFTPIATLSDTFFTFDLTKHKGVEVIDFR